ncbi:Protein BZZ1 [Elasticomyces elasticus]|nr:Protein BZZ1 [Elasticomyces elasticus]
MAAIDIAPNFGAELKDGFKPVNAWVSGGIAWLDDIQQFYRERSAIEKEYSQKLSALAKKYFEKKAKKSSILSVGETPTVAPGSLERYDLTTLESRATEHERFSGQLITSLAEPLKNLAARYEDLQKHHADYAKKLEAEKDTSYADLKKTKGRYDSVCQEVENRRKKIDSSFDHGKSKAQTAYAQQQSDMRNMKNTYLITINVTNKQKERYYHEYVPDLLDSLQDLSETRVSKLNSIWSLAAQIETQTLNHSADLLKHLSSEIPRNNPVLDSMMFVRHNAMNWRDPPDFVFEPSPVWLDDDAMAVDEASKTFLRNTLTRSKALLTGLRRDTEQKRKEVEGAKRVRQNIREGKDKRDEVEVVRAQFALQESLHDVLRRLLTAETEVSTITNTVGDLSLGARNHAFKTQTFKIPTNCDLCGERIWGLSAKGCDCKDCGFTCHGKCEMKVPADCPGEISKDDRKKVKQERQAAAQAAVPSGANGAQAGGAGDVPKLGRSDTMGSMNTLSSGYSASAHRSVSGTTAMSPTEEGAPQQKAGVSAARKNRIVAPPPTQYIGGSSPFGDANGRNGVSGDEQRGKMMYPYKQNGDGEISVDEGREVVVLEPDDGSGWLKIRSPTGAEGLVPTSYVDLVSVPHSSSQHLDRPTSMASVSTTSLAGSVSSTAPSVKKKGPAVAPRRGAKKLKYVEALYMYEARAEGEVSMDEGERMLLIAPDGGDGWCEVERGGVRGVVPAGWVREV